MEVSGWPGEQAQKRPERRYIHRIAAITIIHWRYGDPDVVHRNVGMYRIGHRNGILMEKGQA